MNTPPPKAVLRPHFRAARVALSESQRHAARDAVSETLAGRLKALSISGAVAVYLATPVELDLSPTIDALLAVGRSVVAPRGDGFARLTRASQLGRDRRGNAEPDGEPVEVEEIGLFLVPGLAFTTDGARLGQGGGWYDRALAMRKPGVPCIGIAFDEQLADELRSEPHDILMDFVATPSRFIDCRAARAGGESHAR